MEWTALPFDGNPRALLHDVARACASPHGLLARVGYVTLGHVGALRECTRGNRGLGRVARVGRKIEISFIFSVKLLMLIQFSFQAEL